MLVCGVPVDLSETNLLRFHFSPDYQAPITTVVFDYRMGQEQDCVMIRDTAHKVTLMRWDARHIDERGTDGNWVSGFKPIIKASLNFASKFWWVVVCICIWPNHMDNILMPYQLVLISSIIAGYNINFIHYIVEKIHERALRRLASIPFPCLVYLLCIDAGAEIIPNVLLMIDVHRTQDACNIKAN